MPASDRTPISTTIDFNCEGKQQGHLAIPYSHNLSGWANLPIHITVIRNGDGPAVLAMAGNHGDEYPGQVAIMRLCHQLEAQDVKGLLILIPCLNPPAAKAGTRLSPLDGKNFNRCFPGNPRGTVSEMLAHYLSSVLFPMVDTVIDLHTGGRSTNFIPCAHMHLVPDPAQRTAMIDAAEAFNTAVTFLYTDVAGTGLLPSEAERQGKIVITTEMGGGEPVPASIHRQCQSGLRNVLIHRGVLRGKFQTRAAAGLGPARWVQALGPECYRFAPDSGLYENMVDLGETVRVGQPLGLLHSIERPDRDPIPVTASVDGILVANRAPSLVSQGDCLGVVAQDTDPRSLP